MGDLTPITREEYYLARMAGEDVTMPEPITREEEYMKGIAAQIEAGSAELPAVTDADEGKILAVNTNGKWDKADAPTPPSEMTPVDIEISTAITNVHINLLSNISYKTANAVHLFFVIESTDDDGIPPSTVVTKFGSTTIPNAYIGSSKFTGAGLITASRILSGTSDTAEEKTMVFYSGNTDNTAYIGCDYSQDTTWLRKGKWIIKGEYPIAPTA